MHCRLMQRRYPIYYSCGSRYKLAFWDTVFANVTVMSGDCWIYDYCSGYSGHVKRGGGLT